jgi:hypothetical protein
MIELKPVCVANAELIFESWGRCPQNFARLTARVFTDVGDAERYLNSLSSAPAWNSTRGEGAELRRDARPRRKRCSLFAAQDLK